MEEYYRWGDRRLDTTLTHGTIIDNLKQYPVDIGR